VHNTADLQQYPDEITGYRSWLFFHRIRDSEVSSTVTSLSLLGSHPLPAATLHLSPLLPDELTVDTPRADVGFLDGGRPVDQVGIEKTLMLYRLLWRLCTAVAPDGAIYGQTAERVLQRCPLQ